ncbi:MAG: coenzyme F420-0:L-glutamate ligase [Promethearchaeota archaeon]|jgi:coenzyme F420-0:L-glutamate ligase/coenzyme F420-1:gamma-L-glutamate ligase
MNSKYGIEIIGLKGIPLVNEGDNIPKIILNSLKHNDLSLKDRDIIVIAQSLVSKSIGQTRNLDDITPSEKAIELFNFTTPKAEKQGLPKKDPQLIQLILDEAKEIIRAEHVLITETKHGFICADAGIDKSNIEGNRIVTLLPEDPDYQADKIRNSLKNKTHKEIAVIISDSFGRSFRVGAVGVSIGVSGINPILDLRGEKDLFGYELQSTIIGQTDSLASAAQLVMGESNEGIPVVLIRGYNFEYNEKSNINSILRNKDIDLFRESEGIKVTEFLKKRRSYKIAFDDKSVDRKLVEECIEIAGWAPSAHNGQFWRYVILGEHQLREKLINNMNQKLRNDLKNDGKTEEFIKSKVNRTRLNFIKAPVLILLCLDKLEFDDYPDDERQENEFILGIQSISSSATYFLLAIELKKLASSWYCAPLFAKEIIKDILNLPESYVPMAFFTVGYPLKTVPAPPRKKLQDIIYDPIV